MYYIWSYGLQLLQGQTLSTVRERRASQPALAFPGILRCSVNARDMQCALYNCPSWVPASKVVMALKDVECSCASIRSVYGGSATVACASIAK